MSEQKRKVAIAATLAVISVFLLSGASFTLFPTQVTSQVDSAVGAVSAMGGASSSDSVSQQVSRMNYTAGNYFLTAAAAIAAVLVVAVSLNDRISKKNRTPVES